MGYWFSLISGILTILTGVTTVAAVLLSPKDNIFRGPRSISQIIQKQNIKIENSPNSVGAININNSPGTTINDNAEVLSAVERSIFLQEETKPIERVIIFLQLKREYTTKELGHFRILFEITDTSQSSNPILRFTTRDANNSDYIIGGSSSKNLYGIKTILRSQNPDVELQNTIIGSLNLTKTKNIVSTGGIRGRGSFQTIENFDGASIKIYLTDSLLDKVEYIGFAADNYVLFGLPVNCLDSKKDAPSIDWLEKLSDEERMVEWVRLQPKRYWPNDDSRAPLGPPLKMDFEKYTPVKRDIDTVSKGWEPITVPACDLSEIYPPH